MLSLKMTALMCCVLLTSCAIKRTNQEEMNLILNSIESEEDVLFWKCVFKPKWYETKDMTIKRCLK